MRYVLMHTSIWIHPLLRGADLTADVICLDTIEKSPPAMGKRDTDMQEAWLL